MYRSALSNATARSRGPNTKAKAPADLRAAAVRAAATFDNEEAAVALLAPKRLAALTPLDRDVTVSALLARPAHVPRVLDAVESGALPRTAVSAAARTALSKNKDAAIKARSAKLFGAAAEGDRMKAYEASKAVTIPVIGLGGIATGEDAAEFLIAGASAVEVGTATFWDPEAPARIAGELDEFCKAEGIGHVRELTATLQF